MGKEKNNKLSPEMIWSVEKTERIRSFILQESGKQSPERILRNKILGEKYAADVAFEGQLVVFQTHGNLSDIEDPIVCLMKDGFAVPVGNLILNKVYEINDLDKRMKYFENKCDLTVIDTSNGERATFNLNVEFSIRGWNTDMHTGVDVHDFGEVLGSSVAPMLMRFIGKNVVITYNKKK